MKRTIASLAWIVPLIMVGGNARSAPLPVTLTVNPAVRQQAAQPRLLGSNTPWVYGSEGLMDDQGRWRPGMMQRAREWSPPVLRYPGGSLSDRYHWRKGTGPLAQRQPVLAYEGQPPQKIVYGTQEFLEACEALGAEPLITVNMHEGTEAEVAREAADWVRQVNGQTLVSRQTGKALPKVIHWELGNEPYLMDSRQPDGRPNPRFLRPDQYARRVNAVMAAMRAADSTIHIGLPFALDTLSGRPWRPNGEPATVVGEQLGYADRLLAGLERPQDVAFLALHYYMPNIASPPEVSSLLHLLPGDEALYWGTVAGSETIRQSLRQVSEFWSQHPRTARLPLPRFDVTEYNAFYTNAKANGQELKQNRYVMTQAAALFVADLIGVLSGQPNVELATQWSLSSNWVFGAIAPATEAGPQPVRPVFQAMRLARSLLQAGSEHVQTRVGVETSERVATPVGFAAPFPHMPLVTAVATRRGQTLKVLVVNKDPQRAAEITLNLTGGSQARNASAEQVQADGGIFSHPGSPLASVPVRGRVVMDDDGQHTRWTLAPASFGLLQFDLSK